MRQILEDNDEMVREAGRRLAEVGNELAAGRFDEVFCRIGTERIYPAWEELIQAKTDIEEAIQKREGAIAVQQVLVDLLSSILSSVFRFRMP